MRGGIHDTFTVVTAHTAKCDICNKNNKDKMYRCNKCGRQKCTPCWETNGGDGRHALHNKENLKYKGPKAEDLPPKESKSIKIEAVTSTRGSGLKTNRDATTPVTLADRTGAYAPTAITPLSDEKSCGSERKRVRKAPVKDSTDEEEVYLTAKYGPIDPTVKRKKPIKQQKLAETSPKQSSPDREYPLESAVNNLIDAAGSDTESETDATHESSKDHEGLNSILQAADILERDYTHMHSSPPVKPSTTAEANDDVKLPPRTQAWTPVNANKTNPNHRGKASKQNGFDNPVGYAPVGYAPGSQPVAARSPHRIRNNDQPGRHVDLKRKYDVEEDLDEIEEELDEIEDELDVVHRYPGLAGKGYPYKHRRRKSGVH